MGVVDDNIVWKIVMTYPNGRKITLNGNFPDLFSASEWVKGARLPGHTYDLAMVTIKQPTKAYLSEND